MQSYCIILSFTFTQFSLYDSLIECNPDNNVVTYISHKIFFFNAMDRSSQWNLYGTGPMQSNNLK